MKRQVFLGSLLWAHFAFAQTEIKTTVFGDIRLREEALEVEGGTGKDNYDQLRLRARLGVKAQIHESLSTEFRLASGAGGTSTNQNFSGTKNYDFKLDRAYAKYTPQEVFMLKAGRTDSPYVLVGENNMLFDSDLNFDGASAVYTGKADNMSWQIILAHSVLTESANNVPNADAFLDSAEVTFRISGETQSILITAAEHSFKNVKKNAVVVGSSGNTTSGGAYAYGYDVTSVGLEYGLKLSLPIIFFAEMAQNNQVSKNNSALIFGIKLNKLKTQGDWMVAVDSREVEKDATLGSLADSDAFGGGTNGRNLSASFGYALDDNSNLMATYMKGETLIASGETSVDRNRVQVDLNIKF